MNESPILQIDNDPNSSYNGINALVQEAEKMLEESEESSSGMVIPHFEVERIEQEPLERSEKNVEISNQDIEEPQSQSKMSIAVVSTSLPIENDPKVQTENSTEIPLKAQTVPAIGQSEFNQIFQFKRKHENNNLIYS